MNKSSLFGERLKKIRNGLDKTQSEMADMCGITREAWGRYEAGKATPGGDVLAALAENGIDIGFVLTGHEPDSHRIPLSESEETLLMYYKKCDGYGRNIIEATAAAVAEPKGHYQADV